MREFRNRVAVVTGAASGIGFGFAEAFVREGMRVVLSDIDDATLQESVAVLREAGGDVLGVHCDVRDYQAVEALAERSVSHFGAVHVMCNNAGVDTGAPFAEIPLKVWDWVFDVNVRGVVHGCLAFLPLLREAGEGHIVNTASMAALSGFLPTGTPYVASKFAVLGLSENLQHELEMTDPKIGVSVVCPAFIQSRMPSSERNLPADVPSLDNHPKRRPIVDFAREQVEKGLPASVVADHVVDAIREQRFFVLPQLEAGIAAVEARVRWMRDNLSPPALAGRPGL